MDDFDNPEVVKQVVICCNKFAFNLYKELINSSGEDGNFVTSPFALSVALAGAYFGAEGETKAQIKQALKLDTFEMNDDDIHEAFGELTEFILDSEDSEECNYSMWTGVFGQEGFPFEESYEEGMKKLKAELRSLDFGSAHEEAMAEINKWVENSTVQQIKQIMHSLDSETLLAMVNVAIYKGLWMEKFSRAKREFFTVDASAGKTSFLVSTQECSYVELEHLKAEVISIPYVNDDLSFIVVLPKDKNGLAFTEQEMTGDAIDEVVKSMEDEVMRIEIPKFRLEFGLNLEETLRKMSITDMFELGQADLSGVDGTEALYVKKFSHRTLFEVSDEGADPASNENGKEVREFVANHPFLYFVRDNRTESILLMGRYTSPPGKTSPVEGASAGRLMSLYKRMSSKEGSGTVLQVPPSPTKLDPPTPQQKKKAQAPAPPPVVKTKEKVDPEPAVIEVQVTFDKESETIKVPASQPQPLPPPPPSRHKKKKKSKLPFFCCMRETTDIDFDTY